LNVLAALAGAAGLDRLPMVGTPPVLIAGYLPSGHAQAHRYLWHLDKARLLEAANRRAERAPSDVHRPTFVALASFGTPIPQVDTSIAGTQARWDPRAEDLADARHRLRAETNLPRDTIDSELVRIGEDG